MLEISQRKWQTKTFASRDKIIADMDTLWSIGQGAVKVSTYDSSGKIIVLGYWGKGDVVGRSLSRLDPYEIECLTFVEADCIPYRDWHLVAKEVRNCYQDAEQLLYILKQANLEDKLIELLIYLANKFGSIEEKDKVIMLPLTHRELAEFFGVTRANIVAEINKLQCKKIIDNPRQGKIILHPSEIARLEYKI